RAYPARLVVVAVAWRGPCPRGGRPDVLTAAPRRSLVLRAIRLRGQSGPGEPDQTGDDDGGDVADDPQTVDTAHQSGSGHQDAADRDSGGDPQQPVGGLAVLEVTLAGIAGGAAHGTYRPSASRRSNSLSLG